MELDLICEFHQVAVTRLPGELKESKNGFSNIAWGCPKCDREEKRKKGECTCGFVCPRLGYLHLPDCQYRPPKKIKTSFGTFTFKQEGKK